ncbi:hypothetical protein ACOI1H_17630 [Loktanella sp. DJP18]|uniref:hypothetical protein n=1 Tax=Loktanella sp. DJP18 TaxID=3409788 RepID=UPI003BB706EA
MFVLADDATNALGDFGWAAWQGNDEPADGKTTKQIGELYAEIMGARTIEIFMGFKVPEDKVEAMKAAAQALGARHI